MSPGEPPRISRGDDVVGGEFNVHGSSNRDPPETERSFPTAWGLATNVTNRACPIWLLHPRPPGATGRGLRGVVTPRRRAVLRAAFDRC